LNKVLTDGKVSSRFIASLAGAYLIMTSVCFGQAPSAPIRTFDIATTERLGRAIFEQDGLAAQATDVLFAQHLDLAKEGLHGWIIDFSTSPNRVDFVRDHEGTLEAAYEIAFSMDSKPRFSALPAHALAADELAQFNARNLVLRNIEKPCSRSYNTVVLKEPNSDRWLVWALAATNKPNVILFGGHYRFTISRDGTSIVSRDALSRSCLEVDAKPKQQANEQPVGLYVTNPVSEMPLETHVYLSLLFRTPIFVGTSDRAVWSVDHGHMTRVNAESPALKPVPK
jgi:hypothetical protein